MASSSRAVESLSPPAGPEAGRTGGPDSTLLRALRPPVPKARGRRRGSAETVTSLTRGPRDPIGSPGGAVAQLGER